MKKFFIATIIFFGLILRLQNFNLPAADAHAMRQTDTESVAFNFAIRNPNILYPQNSLMRPQSNIQSYFFLEFPLYQYGIGILYKIFGPHIQLARIYNLSLFLASCFFLYFFVKNFFDEKIAVWSLFFFTFAPGSIFFIGHAIHPDVFATFAILLSLASYIYWKKCNNLIVFFVSILSLSIAVSTRPFAALILPAYLFILWQMRAKWFEYLLICSGSIALYSLWKLWQSQFPGSDYTFENWILAGRENLFKPDPFFRQLIYKNIIGEILGKSASLFASFGIVAIILKKNARYFFPLLWLFCVPIYWYIAPYGNLFHQYYANVYLVPMVLMAGIGSSFVIDKLDKFKILQNIFIAFVIFLTVYNGYRTSSNFFKDIVPLHYFEIAKEIEKIVPFDDRLVYLGRLNSVPFSLVHRRGWMLGASPVDVDENVDTIVGMKKYGAKYIVAGAKNNDLSEEEMIELEKRAKLIYKSNIVKIFKL